MPTNDERLTTLELKVEKMDIDVKHHFAELRDFIVAQVAPLASRVDHIEVRLGRLDGRLDRLEHRFDRVDGKLDEVLLRLARR